MTLASTATALATLAELTSGLLWISESDHPLSVVRPKAPPEGAEQVDLMAFFARATEPQPYHTSAELERVERYRALVRFLNEELEDACVYRVGAIEVDVYALGKSRQGEWLGVATKLVET